MNAIGNYPANHYTNTRNAHSPLYVSCADALRRDGSGLCRTCLFLKWYGK